MGCLPCGNLARNFDDHDDAIWISEYERRRRRRTPNRSKLHQQLILMGSMTINIRCVSTIHSHHRRHRVPAWLIHIGPTKRDNKDVCHETPKSEAARFVRMVLMRQLRINCGRFAGFDVMEFKVIELGMSHGWWKLDDDRKWRTVAVTDWRTDYNLLVLTEKVLP